MNTRCTIIVTGTVQAGGYREKVRKAAVAGGLKGYVANLADRSVKIVCEGQKTAIERFLRAIDIKKGRIEVSEMRPKYSKATGQFRIFEIRLRRGLSPDTLEILERLDNGLVIMDRLGEKQDATRDDIKTMDSNIGGHFERLEGRQDATIEAVKAVSSDLKAVDSNIKSMDQHIRSMDSNIGGHFERLEGRQDATTEAVKTLSSDIRSMDSNIGGHFDRLDQKYDAFGASLAQAADDIHDMKGDMHVVKGDISVMKGDLRKAVVRRKPSHPA